MAKPEGRSIGSPASMFWYENTSAASKMHDGNQEINRMISATSPPTSVTAAVPPQV